MQMTIMDKTFNISKAYSLYPYKKMHKLRQYRSNYGYVNVNEVSNHKLSIDYYDYKKIIILYFDTFMDELMKGNPVDLPYGLGNIIMMRSKPNKKRLIDYSETRKLFNEWNKQNPKNKKIIFRENQHSFGEALYCKWYAGRNYITNKGLYKLKIAPQMKKRIYDFITENSNNIFNYQHGW